MTKLDWQIRKAQLKDLFPTIRDFGLGMLMAALLIKFCPLVVRIIGVTVPIIIGPVLLFLMWSKRRNEK